MLIARYQIKNDLININIFIMNRYYKNKLIKEGRGGWTLDELLKDLKWKLKGYTKKEIIQYLTDHNLLTTEEQLEEKKLQQPKIKKKVKEEEKKLPRKKKVKDSEDQKVELEWTSADDSKNKIFYITKFVSRSILKCDYTKLFLPITGKKSEIINQIVNQLYCMKVTEISKGVLKIKTDKVSILDIKTKPSKFVMKLFSFYYQYNSLDYTVFYNFLFPPDIRTTCKNKFSILQEDLIDINIKKFIKLHDYGYDCDELIEYLTKTENSNINPYEINKIPIWYKNNEYHQIVNNSNINLDIKTEYIQMLEMLKQKKIDLCKTLILDETCDNNLQQVYKTDEIFDMIADCGFKLYNDNITSFSLDSDVFKSSQLLLANLRDKINNSGNKDLYLKLNYNSTTLAQILDDAHNRCIHGVGTSLMNIYMKWWLRCNSIKRIKLNKYYYKIDKYLFSTGIQYSKNPSSDSSPNEIYILKLKIYNKTEMENYDFYKSHSNDKSEYKSINNFKLQLFEYYSDSNINLFETKRYSSIDRFLFQIDSYYEQDLVISELLTENFNTRVNLQNKCLLIYDNGQNIIAIISYIDTHIECCLIKIYLFHKLLTNCKFTSITTSDELQINILTSHFPNIKIINPINRNLP